MNYHYQSTKLIELGSTAFRQWRAGTRCSNIHGYLLSAKFWFEGELDDKNWVFDYGALKDLKTELQQTFDHTTVVAVDDPHLNWFQEAHNKGIINLRVLASVGTEKFAEYCLNIADIYVQKLTNLRVRCVKVEVFEHEKNSAIYTKQNNVCLTSGVDTVNEESYTCAPLKDLSDRETAVQRQPAPAPAQVGNTVTYGNGNWFAGTTWG